MIKVNLPMIQIHYHRNVNSNVIVIMLVIKLEKCIRILCN